MPQDLERFVISSGAASESALERLERNGLAKFFTGESYKVMIAQLREIKGAAEELALLLASAKARFDELDASIHAHIDSENAARRSAADSIKGAEFVAAAPNIHEAKAGEFQKKVSDEKESVRVKIMASVLEYNKKIRKLRSWRHDDAIKSFALDKIWVPGGDTLPREINLDATEWRTSA